MADDENTIRGRVRRYAQVTTAVGGLAARLAGFASFEQTAAAAASLGQVHRATALDDGAELAVKLQYPDMQSAVEADLNQLKLVFAIYERYDRAIATGQIHAEIAARLRE